ncbi:MAG TPA: hypothetical protein PLZ84_04050, partial [Clostridia bacterium]|nr:hypothetical protein [Clostridia bacterium]
MDMKAILSGKNNDMYKRGPHTSILIYRKRKVVGRLLCGINPQMKIEEGKTTGYFSLFEAEDENVGKELLAAAEKWFSENGADIVVGPWSPDDGEGWRGFLIEGRDGPPILMNAYTKEWYPSFFEKQGFEKYMDIYALKLDINKINHDKLTRLAAASKEKSGYIAESVDMSRVYEEAKDFYDVLVKSYPPEWEALLPSYEYVLGFIKAIKSIVDPDLIS